MSTSLEPIVDFEDIVDVNYEFEPKLFNNKKSLKSKENKFQSKSRKELKKKLKKYKLRRDGQEDPEVLDVSQILVSALKIKSPTNKLTSTHSINDFDELKPRNYLFKMGRKKQVIQKKVDPGGGDTAVTNNELERKNEIASAKSLCNTIEEASDEIKVVEVDVKSKLDLDNNSSKKSNKNAFTLMMDSRNKSIGSNSPGKERVVNELDLEIVNEKKNVKVKRNLLLQKMAEAKGSVKRKEMEEYMEKCVKDKMDKRAERLKKMIKRNKLKPVKTDEKSSKKETTKIVPINNNKEVSPLLKNKLHLVSIFNDSVKSENIPNKKKEVVSEEENEFLKKLSPSLKKKENMLCYFKKVEKELEGGVNSQDNDEVDVIKIKFKSKIKHKTKRKKLTLNKAVLTENLQSNDENHISKQEVADLEKGKNNKKEKHVNDKKKTIVLKNDSVEPTGLDLTRPRRNIKRPAKYIDDVQASSSDEDLHIFTPKKKKHADQQNNCISRSKINNVDEPKPKQSANSNKNIVISDSEKNTKKVANKHVTITQKHTKLAPIFAAKPQLDAAALEARQKFLSSGVPDKLKKMVEKHTNKTVGVNHFHTVVHVQQKNATSNVVVKTEILLSQNDINEKSIDIVHDENFFKNMLILKQESKNELNFVPRAKIQTILQNIKQFYPKFPVYRTYRLLKDKKRGDYKDCSYLHLDNSIEVINGLVDINNESPDKLCWTDKYKALSSKQIIGNFECLKELKKWLISWTENDDKVKKNKNTGSDSSDFYLSDTDSKDSMKCANNLVVLTGPVGSGKTSLVYAVAAELAIKVLEVNASSKRTGKIMLQDLQEATQSHKVNRGKCSQENSQKSQEIAHNETPKETKKRGRKKKSKEGLSKKAEPMILKNEISSQPSGSQDNGSRTCMSLILIDDADIVFDQDDGFCSAIVQLVQCSKRPVILITSSTSCPHLQRFLQCAKIIHTRSLIPRMLGTWLDIMCLVDIGTCWPGLGAKCLDYFKGDIRRTINFLQFQTTKDIAPEDERISQNIDDYKAIIEDESSNMSWSDREGIDEKFEIASMQSNLSDNNIWQDIITERVSLHCFKCPVNTFKIWWNIPRLLLTPIDPYILGEYKKLDNDKTPNKNNLELDAISNVADIISITEYYYHPENDMKAEIISVPWANFPSHSVSELENFDKFDKSSETTDEICHYLLYGSVLKARSDLGLEPIIDLEFPGMKTKR